jgi:hypothetical protein
MRYLFSSDLDSLQNRTVDEFLGAVQLSKDVMNSTAWDLEVDYFIPVELK